MNERRLQLLLSDRARAAGALVDRALNLSRLLLCLESTSIVHFYVNDKEGL